MATAAEHLTTVITRWPDLVDALVARNTSTWPPAGLRHHMQSRDADEVDWLTAHRYLDRRTDQLGETPAPIRLDLLDEMRDIEQQLRYLADTTAAAIQRPPMTKAPAGWLLCDQMRRNRLVREDVADPRRWNWKGSPRGGTAAAEWLRARLNREPGPFVRPLSVAERQHITSGASAVAARVERALAEARRSTPVSWPCPHCRGQLAVLGGDGQAPAVKCEDCGRTWRERIQA